MYTVADILDVLHVRRVGANRFEASSFDTPWGRVYGGQVLAQALQAAFITVNKDRLCHSLHAYFILPGKWNVPIFYEVDTIRDGGSFTTRRIVARQNNHAIFNMSASFSCDRPGFEHQFDLPKVPMPEELISDEEYNLRYKESHPDLFESLSMVWPIEMRRNALVDHLNPKNAEPKRAIWTKIKGKIPKDRILQQVLLTFISDYNIMSTGILPNREEYGRNKYFLTSLNHAMWFHRDFDLNDWVLYDLDSPSSFGGRTLGRGTYFNRAGKLIASVTQEGLIIKQKNRMP